MKKLKLITIVIALFFMNAQNMNAQQLGIDSTFGKNGIIETRLGFKEEGEYIAVQKDDKILLFGVNLDSNFVSKNYYLHISRFNKNGLIDTNFGNNGVVTVITSASAKDVRPAAIKLQEDGKIIVISKIYESPYYKSLIHRFNTNGNLDNSFGNNGVIEIGVDKSNASMNNITILPDGSIVGIGKIYEDATKKKLGLLVEKYDKNGIKDLKFANNGRLSLFLSNSKEFYGYYIDFFKKDGSLVLLTQASSPFQIIMYKIDSNGKFDDSFGNSGNITINDPKLNVWSNKFVITKDNKIIVSIQSLNNKGYLNCYSENGKVDNSFGINGVSEVSIPTYSVFLNDIIITPNQEILASCHIQDYIKSNRAFISKFSIDGKPELSFGDNGKLRFNYYYYTWVSNIALQSDGKVICNELESKGQYLYRINVKKTVSTSKVVSDLKNITLFPNPIVNQATLSIELTSSQSLDIQLIDINGRRVSDFTTTKEVFAAGKNEIPLDLPSSLTSGTYFLNIRSQEGVSVVKMVKM